MQNLRKRDSLEEAGTALESTASRLASVEAERDALRVQVDALRAVLRQVRDVGHNNDCMFCGFKDRAVDAALTGAEARGEGRADLIDLHDAMKARILADRRHYGRPHAAQEVSA